MSNIKGFADREWRSRLRIINQIRLVHLYSSHVSEYDGTEELDDIPCYSYIVHGLNTEP